MHHIGIKAVDPFLFPLRKKRSSFFFSSPALNKTEWDRQQKYIGNMFASSARES